LQQFVDPASTKVVYLEQKSDQVLAKK